jgi:ubiquinone/menaquinone biosynthesis C-methylase UbiE
VAEGVAEPFTLLASVYDVIMAEVEYEEWAGFILALANARGYGGGPLLDLGCGTGNSTAPMHERGLDVTGVDASAAMLAVARDKLPEVEFHQAGFTELRLERTFELVYSVFDALNNLLTDVDMREALARVYHHLEPGGLFIFDVNTPTGLRDLWEGGKAEGWADDVFYRWTHTYDELTGLAHVEALCSTSEGSFVERHSERGYDAVDLARLLAGAGFTAIEVVTFPDAEPAPVDADRIWVVATRP